ncbi:MAG: DinB family protein [Chloroflexi bacterium]|nr:DinB family protein [Chloroflexota bacterium]
MSGTRTTLSALERNWNMVKSAVSDVDEATMAVRPNEDSNSMSWLVWHMSRVTDRFIHFRLKVNEPQLWTIDSWHEKFGMPEDSNDMGMGWTSERAAAWQAPSKDVLMDYFDKANTTAAAYIGSLSDADLAREVPWNNPGETMVVDDALGILVWDNIVHGGQVAYLRGYHQGMGWHR